MNSGLLPLSLVIEHESKVTHVMQFRTVCIDNKHVYFKTVSDIIFEITLDVDSGILWDSLGHTGVSLIWADDAPDLGPPGAP